MKRIHRTVLCSLRYAAVKMKTTLDIEEYFSFDIRVVVDCTVDKRRSSLSYAWQSWVRARSLACALLTF